MNLDEQIEFAERIGAGRQIIASLRELKRLREVLDEIAFFEGTPMPPGAADDFARNAKEARRESSDGQ